jgi:hypothetical protein
MRGLWPFVVSVVLLFAVLTIGCCVAFGMFGKTGLLLAGAGFLLFWIIAEFATAILYFTYAKFTCAARHTNAEQARCSEPGDGALVDNRRSAPPGH